MVKNMTSRFLVFSLLIAILSACSKQTEYTHVIPANATAILSINQKALADKAGVNDKENEAMKQKLIEAMKSGTNAATFEQIEKIIKNPSESGIDTGSPVYFFTSPDFSYAMVSKISDKSKLESTIDIAVKEKLCEPIAQADGFQYVYFYRTLLAYNESALLAVGVYGDKETVKEQITGLLKQTEENSIVKNKGFQKMLEMKGDVKYIASMAAVPSVYARQITMSMTQGFDMKDLMVVGDVNFEKGKITAHFEYYTENEALKEQIKKQEANTTKLNGTFLKYFPASTILFTSVGIQGDEIYKQLMENKDFRENFSIAEGEEFKNLFHSFKGDISMGLLNIGIQNGISMSNPQKGVSFVAYAELTDGMSLNKIYENKKALSLKKGDDLIKLSENNYVYKSRDLNIFFGVKDKMLYATNDEMVNKSIFKDAKPSIKELEYASNIKGKNIYFALNMDAILELPVVKMLATMGGEQFAMYQNLASQVSYLEITNEANKGQMTFSLKNKDTNALKQMVDFARQFAGM